MSQSVHSEIHLHIVWHTKESRAFITPEMEDDLYGIVRKRIGDEGAIVRAVGGTENHIHVAVTVPPTLTISEFIGRLKGGSAHDVNVLPQWRKSLQWQAGYGIVSFRTRELPWVVAYVNNQKRHHADGTTQETLERTEPEAQAE